MSNECKCQIPNTDLTGRCFKCGGAIEIPTSNNQLPADAQELIKADAERYTKDEGYQKVYIAGATAVHERAQKMADVLDNIGNGPFPITQKELEEWLLKTKAMAREALGQWKGAGKEQFTGSIFASPAPGITLGCISPEARELLDTIMEAWEKHYAGMKEMHGTAMLEPTFYGFAYWLVRWSGLIQPATH